MRGEQREKNKVGERNKMIQKEIGTRGGEERRGIEGKKKSREERKTQREGEDSGWGGERINGERGREKKRVEGERLTDRWTIEMYHRLPGSLWKEQEFTVFHKREPTPNSA